MLSLRKILFQAILCPVLIICVGQHAWAETSDVLEIKNDLTNPKKVGSGPFQYFGFKVYEANYYVSEDASNTSFALRLDYVRKVMNEDLVKATIKQMSRLGASESESLKWQNELEKIFPNVDAGHYLTAIYQPTGVTTFIHNGKVLGKIADLQFSKTFFKIWLDSKTNAPELRTQLLNNLCPPRLIDATCIK